MHLMTMIVDWSKFMYFPKENCPYCNGVGSGQLEINEYDFFTDSYKKIVVTRKCEHCKYDNCTMTPADVARANSGAF